MKFRNDARRLVMYTYIFGPRTATNYNIYNVHITYRITLPPVCAVKEAMTTFVTYRLPKPLFSFRLYTVAGRSLCSSDHSIISSNNNGKISTGLCVSNFIEWRVWSNTIVSGVSSVVGSTGFFFSIRVLRGNNHGSKNGAFVAKTITTICRGVRGTRKILHSDFFNTHSRLSRYDIEHSNRFADSGCCLYWLSIKYRTKRKSDVRYDQGWRFGKQLWIRFVVTFFYSKTIRIIDQEHLRNRLPGVRNFNLKYVLKSPALVWPRERRT